ncbi:hypothetical protein SKAU_G00395740 [Synaphobranchus kaupii]|uniref:Uncharacterized protein n=1 Tax=Synaphobranchus kaupii TaxID=118154 RepID=A0A9Q1ECI2_SYNKA|nr:hypothetical protein SKAU_G00395740 [Synaphobranchus kaupii]
MISLCAVGLRAGCKVRYHTEVKRLHANSALVEQPHIRKRIRLRPTALQFKVIPAIASPYLRSCVATKDGSAVAETLLAPVCAFPMEDVLCEYLTKPYALMGRACDHAVRFNGAGAPRVWGVGGARTGGLVRLYGATAPVPTSTPQGDAGEGYGPLLPPSFRWASSLGQRP